MAFASRYSCFFALLFVFSFKVEASFLLSIADNMQCSDALVRLVMDKISTGRIDIKMPAVDDLWISDQREETHSRVARSYLSGRIEKLNPQLSRMVFEIYESRDVTYSKGGDPDAAFENSKIRVSLPTFLKRSLFEYGLILHETEHLLQSIEILTHLNGSDNFGRERLAEANLLLRRSRTVLGDRKAFYQLEFAPMKATWELFNTFSEDWRRSEYQLIQPYLNSEGQKWFQRVLLNTDKPFENWLMDDWFSGPSSFENVLEARTGLTSGTSMSPLLSRRSLLCIGAVCAAAAVTIPQLMKPVFFYLNHMSFSQ